MSVASQSAPNGAVPESITRVVQQLAEHLQASNVRLWRYVDSQQALFGFWSICEGEEQPDFDGFVAFLHDREKLDDYVSTAIADLSNETDADGRSRHPLWHVEPSYESLRKHHTEHYMESILVHDRTRSNLTFNDVVGVVCIDAPYAVYERFDDKQEIERLLDRLRDELHKYTLQLFRDGFEAAKPFLRGWSDPAEERPKTKALLQDAIGNLIVAMGHGAKDLSIYARAVNAQENRVPLIAGTGDLHALLSAIEEELGRTALHILTNSFSSHAEKKLAETSGNEPLLFPGSGDSRSFETYRRWLADSRDGLVGVLKADDPRRSKLDDLATRVIEKGSFGVFPIRSIGDGTPGGQLVGLLCVAVSDRRHFFTWTRRMVLERFCEMLGRLHTDHIAPVLTRVTERAHEQLIGSLSTLGKLLSNPGPLGLPHSNDERHCQAFVLSVDLRKSTELMLKMIPDLAQRYAEVLMRLCERMREAVKEEYGIFDKFTGDGVLAFFPDFFSGPQPDACHRAIRAAERCHEAFSECYRDFWPNLSSVPIPGDPRDPREGRAGLGIGIDVGKVRLVNVGDELTVVGAPVVYACRLSSAAEAFTTYLNYPAYHALKASRLLIDCEETPIQIKNDGILAYRVLHTWPYEPDPWSLENTRPWESCTE